MTPSVALQVRNLDKVDALLRLLMGTSWIAEGERVPPGTIRVYLDNEDVTANTTAALLPERSGHVGLGWVELVETETLPLRFIRHYGLVRWEWEDEQHQDDQNPHP